MDIITDQYENISINQLYSKLSIKQEELSQLEKKNELESIGPKDYIDTSITSKNYDVEDFTRVLEKFRNKDSEIRTHEQAHASIGHTTSPISYNYQEGPDGKMYAVGGSVRLDTSIPDEPTAAAFKLEMIQKAALGVTNLSSADGAIASQSNLNKILLELQGDEYGTK
ncbi:putative metalloprotease CJM1_0395 family protein [Arcobacteraceae bacterium]|nr:putative metalloprotease CJM1_0395 family protein [Arcobacteraceae bacterium]